MSWAAFGGLTSSTLLTPVRHVLAGRTVDAEGLRDSMLSRRPATA